MAIVFQTGARLLFMKKRTATAPRTGMAYRTSVRRTLTTVIRSASRIARGATTPLRASMIASPTAFRTYASWTTMTATTTEYRTSVTPALGADVGRAAGGDHDAALTVQRRGPAELAFAPADRRPNLSVVAREARIASRAVEVEQCDGMLVGLAGGLGCRIRPNAQGQHDRSQDDCHGSSLSNGHVSRSLRLRDTRSNGSPAPLGIMATSGGQRLAGLPRESQQTLHRWLPEAYHNRGWFIR